MKKALIKDSLKEIKKSFKRFFSILLMSLLGAGFFCGLRAASPDMRLTLDNFFDKSNLYDIQIISTLGMVDEDVEALKKVDGVNSVYKDFSKDIKMKVDNKEYILNATILQEGINMPNLVTGKMPSSTNECVVENTLLTTTKKNIGDTIKIEEVLNNDEEANFKETELKIVGVVESPLYISRERGTTNLGSGKINFYIYVNSEILNTDYYTSLYLKVDGAKELNTTSKEYEELISNTIDNIKEIEPTQKMIRYNELIGEATQKLDDAQNDLNTQKIEAEEKIKDAEDKINLNEQKLINAQNDLSINKKKANNEFEKAKEKIFQAKLELENSKQEYEEKKKEAEIGFEEAEKKKEEISTKLNQVKDGIATLEENKLNLEKLISEQGSFMTEVQLAEANYQIEYLNGEINSLNENKSEIEAGIEQINLEVENGKKKLEEGKKQLENAQREIELNENKLNSEIDSTNKKLEDAQKEINDGFSEIEKGKNELADKKLEFNDKISDAEDKLLDARKKVADIEKPEWYIFDRENNNGFMSYKNDADNLEKIAEVFPIVFFIIAVLISLTTMTRMVEEQRGLIGTLKALGYSNVSIGFKYVLYAFLATVIGAIIGMNIGYQLLPRVCISLYGMMYPTVKEIIIEFNVFYAIVGLGLISICIIGATIYAVWKELRSTPAILMRPKAPKAGKRVLLEKIDFIWKRLSFTQKVTVRNMFRYKKRFLMTIIGISGCTALIVTGFGIKDSISNIMNFQYENVYQYNAMATLKNALTDEEIESTILELEERDEIDVAVKSHIQSDKVIANNIEKNAQIIVVENNEEFEKIIHLNDAKTSERLQLDDNSVFISDKLSQLLKIKNGDTIIIQDSEHKEYELKVAGIVEQYMEHFIYMSKSLYEKTFEEDAKTNIIYIKYSNKDFVEDNLVSEILLNNKISTVVANSKSIESVNNMLTALNSVVYILIVSAGLLAFVVLFNLANINISERTRELATIKVLGFYDKEVFDYVNREIVLLTAIGIVLGLVFGKFLNSFIMSTCEIEILRFKRVVFFQSYVYATIITIIFSIIVNFSTNFILKKIDMIESLKSVE